MWIGPQTPSKRKGQTLPKRTLCMNAQGTLECSRAGMLDHSIKSCWVHLMTLGIHRALNETQEIHQGMPEQMNSERQA